MTTKLDIGHGITLRRTVHQDQTHHGWIVEHPPADGLERLTFHSGLCEASFAVCGRDTCPNQPHTLIQEDPLTIHPSFGCPICGLHGWIREGRWVPA